jgi:RNA polymerase sigma-70 factor (ECF subfamily)
MVSQNSYDGIDKYAVDLIRHKVRQLVGKTRFTEDDRPDLEQELIIDLLLRMRYFNPAKAKKTTFMARIVERRIATILEARFAQCRDWRLCQISLNEPLDNGEGDTAEWIDFLDSEGSLISEIREPRAHLAYEIRMDLNRAMVSLPEELRDLYERLRRNTMAEIARDIGIPRSTLYDRLSKLRNAFREAGLEDYL